jgi:hypothetical protein
MSKNEPWPRDTPPPFYLGKGVITSRAFTGSPAPRSRHVNYQPRLIPFGERYLQEYLPCFRSRKADFSIPGLFNIIPRRSSAIESRCSCIQPRMRKESYFPPIIFLLDLGSYDSNLISFWCIKSTPRSQPLMLRDSARMNEYVISAVDLPGEWLSKPTAITQSNQKDVKFPNVGASAEYCRCMSIFPKLESPFLRSPNLLGSSHSHSPTVPFSRTTNHLLWYLAK